MNGLFDTILGLPLHPLVVHAVVTLLPLFGLSLAVCVVSTWWRDRLLAVSFVGLTVSVGFAYVAKESGERLAGHVGLPEDHARWADVLFPVALALWVVALAWLLLRRRSAGVVSVVAGVVMAVLALVVTGLVVVVGHTGAQAAWAGRVPTTTAPAAPGATSTPAAGPSRSGTGTASSASTAYTMSQLATHTTASSCWTAIDGSVYDLTSWIQAHPGGSQPILGLCGKDGSSAFTRQHSTDTKPHEMLATFKIGTLRPG